MITPVLFIMHLVLNKYKWLGSPLTRCLPVVQTIGHAQSSFRRNFVALMSSISCNTINSFSVEKLEPRLFSERCKSLNLGLKHVIITNRPDLINSLNALYYNSSFVVFTSYFMAFFFFFSKIELLFHCVCVWILFIWNKIKLHWFQINRVAI